MSTDLLFAFTTQTEVLAGTLFRFTFPTTVPVLTVGTPACSVQAFDQATAAIAGPFTCAATTSNEVIISGLSTFLPGPSKIAFKISGITNAAYYMAGAAGNILIDTIRLDSQLIIDRATIATPEIKAGKLINFSIIPYNQSNKFTQNNVLWTKVTFSTTNEIPEGGTIEVDYTASVDLLQSAGDWDCWLETGVPRTAAVADPTCTITTPNTGNALTVSNFGVIAGGTIITIVNRCSFTTSNIANMTVKTKDASGNVIDEDDGTQGALTLDAKPAYDSTTAAVTYSTATANTTTSTIQLDFKPGVSVTMTSATVVINIPTGFTLPSGNTATCSYEKNGGTTKTAASCVVSGQVLTAVLASDSDNLGTTEVGEFTIGGTWNTPAIGSSPSSIHEWSLQITVSGSSNAYDYFGSIYSALGVAAFDVQASATEITVDSETQNQWSPYTVSFKIENALATTTSRTPELSIEFGRRNAADSSDAWDSDLGTGIATGNAIGCHSLSGLSDYSTTAPLTCTLTTNTNNSATDWVKVTVTNFADIAASSVVSLRLMAKNPNATLTDLNIRFTSKITDYNGIETTLQQSSSSSLLETKAATSGWNVDNSSVHTDRSVKTVNITTELKQSVKMTAAATITKLLVVAPAGWNFTGCTAVIGTENFTTIEVFADSTNPAVLLTMPATVNLSDTALTDFTISTINNPAYEGLGSGAITVGALDATTPADPVWHNIAALGTSASAAEAAALTFTIESNNLHNQAGDVTYNFKVTPINNIPSGGEIHVIFPTGYDLQYAVCSWGINIQDAATASPVSCSINTGTLTIIVNSFAAITAGTELYIYIDSVKNPNTSQDAGNSNLRVTDTFQAFTLYDNNTSNIIDKVLTGKTLTLSEPLTTGTAEILSIGFFPTNSGAPSDMNLTFNLQSSVPPGGTLTIAVPGGYILPPSLNRDNCVLNMQYATCTLLGSSIQITPASRFSAGASFDLKIFDTTCPPSSVSVGEFGLTVLWNGLTLSQTATGGLTYTPTATSTSTVTTTLNFFPTNASELARYEFTLTATSDFAVGNSVFIWFPSDYPLQLGEPECEIRPAAGAGTISATCSVGSSRSWIRIDNDKVTVTAGTAFEAIINNVQNPINQVTTGSFHVSILNGDSILDLMTTSLIASITSIPSLIQVFNITTSTTDKQADASYYFNIKPSISIPSTNGEVWIRFPDYDYNTELVGFGHVSTCDASSTNGATVTPWFTPTCTNAYKNTIIASGENPSYSVSNNMLTVTINNVKSPVSFAQLKNFEIAIYDTTTKAFLDRSYGTASADDLLRFMQNKFVTSVQDGEATQTVGTGVIIPWTIQTPSKFTPAKVALSFTPLVVARDGVTTGFTITPEIVTIAAGEWQGNMVLTVDSALTYGDFWIVWQLTSDSTEYVPPLNTLVTVSVEKKYMILMDSISTLFLGAPSVPINVVLPEAAAQTAIGVALTPSTGISAAGFCLDAGVYSGSFTVSTSADLTETVGTIGVALDCTNAGSFYLASSAVLGFDLTNIDDDTPGLGSFVINSPKSRHGADMSIQVTESSYFYYTYGARGLAAQDNSTLINGYTEGTSGYHMLPIGSSLTTDFTISALTAESDYILYGILADLTGKQMESTFIIEFNTAEYYDSVYITTRFLDPEPTYQQLTYSIIQVLQSILGVGQGRIVYQEPATGDGESRRLATTTATYLFYNDPTSSLPSPSDLVNSFAFVDELVTQFAAIELNYDPTYNLAGSMTVFPNVRPTWTIQPVVEAQSTSISISLTTSTTGTLYAELVSDEVNVLPSSRQVTELTDAFGAPVAITYTAEVTGGVAVSFVIEGLSPASSYILLISAKNNDSKLPRIMRDDIMSKIEIITKASTGLIDEEDSDFAIWLLSTTLLLLL